MSFLPVNRIQRVIISFFFFYVPTLDSEWKPRMQRSFNIRGIQTFQRPQTVSIKAPIRIAEVFFFNYKGNNNSIVFLLMAVGDAEYKILYFKIGSAADGGIFSTCGLSTTIMNKTTTIITMTALPERNIPLPFRFVQSSALSERRSKNILKRLQ